MQRIAEQDLSWNQRLRARDELAALTKERMERAAGVFQLGLSFNPGALRQRAIMERLPGVVSVGTDSRGVEHMRPGPMPDDPVAYELPYIILPGRNFVNPKTHEIVSRQVAVQLSIQYDNPRARGLRQSLPVDIPAPDRVEVSAVPIVLGATRFDEKHPSSEVLTVSGDYVRAYDDAWEPKTMSSYNLYPYKSHDREAYDWSAFLAYPAEGLTDEMIELHSGNGQNFDLHMHLIQQALLNPDLNPRQGE